MLRRFDERSLAAGTMPRQSGKTISVLPWLIAGAGILLALHHTGTPDQYTVLYAAYYLIAIVIPGTLTFRALRESRGNLPEDLGLGAVTGLLVMLAGWALCAATHLQVLLPGWPLLVIVVFIAVPRLRRYWRIPAERREPLPAAWSWIVAAGLCLMVVTNYKTWATTPLPPATRVYFQDFMYHLALVHEMMRSMPFQVPQVAGDTLRYHYLADADMAMATMVTGVPAQVVLLRLWIVPISALVVFVTAALGRELTGKWWAGALAGLSAIIGMPLALGEPVRAFGQGAVSINSPSEVYSIPLIGLLVLVAVDMLGGRRLGRAWFLVFPLALACAGAKSSGLPPFAFGLVLAGFIVAWRHRDRLRAVVVFLTLVLVALFIGLKIFAGGGASMLSLQPFAILSIVQPYRTTLGVHDVNDGDLSLPYGVEHASLGGALFIAALLCWWVALQSPRLLGLLTVARSRTRTRPEIWLLAGMVIAGAGGTWLLWHPSVSQGYFYLGVTPFAALLTWVLLADQARSWRPVAAGLAFGAMWGLVAPSFAVPRPSSISAWLVALAGPLLLTAAVAAAIASVAVIGWRLRTGRKAWRAVPAGATAALLGAGLVVVPHDLAQLAVNHLQKPHHATTATAPALPGKKTQAQATSSTAKPAVLPAKALPDSPVVAADEMRAALWLDEHAGRDDLVATNVHCRVIQPDGVCDARAFWVSALTGRRMLIESWGYSDEAAAADGVNGLRYYQQPAPDPQIYNLNQQIFTQPNTANLATLRDVYHVKWLYADSRMPGGVAKLLANLTRVRYTAGAATIYEV